jgi:Glycosyltransferase like family
MSSPLQVTFVVAANDQRVMDTNLLASPCLHNALHELIIQQGYSSAALAYNDAIDRSVNDILIFVHQDVFLPASWFHDLAVALDCLQASHTQWAVLGCCGVKQDGRRIGYIYTPGEGVIGEPFASPEPVQTLDELVLIVRKSSQLRFDERLPGFHFYGVDICLAAAAQGLGCYVFAGFCIHNARQYFSYPKEFYVAYRHIKKTWRHSLPIQTSCIRMTKFDSGLWKQRLRAVLLTIRGVEQRGPRRDDPHAILHQLAAEGR